MPLRGPFLIVKSRIIPFEPLPDPSFLSYENMRRKIAISRSLHLSEN